MIDLFFSPNLILWLFFYQNFRCPVPQMKPLNTTSFDILDSGRLVGGYNPVLTS